MKDVQRTTEPTLQQLQDMTTNLWERYNKASLIEIRAWNFSLNPPDEGKIFFRVYIESQTNEEFHTWSSCQTYYNHLMETDMEEIKDI